MIVAFIGNGSIANRHISILKNKYTDISIYIYDYKKNLFYLSEGVQVATWEYIRNVVDAAFICSPSDSHIDYAILFASFGVPIFIEKPIGCSLERLDMLNKIVDRGQISAYVAYPFRHNSEIINLRDMLIDRPPKKGSIITIRWMTNIEKWGKPYSFDKKTGGAILELSHELDILSFLLGYTIDNVNVTYNNDIIYPFETDVFINGFHDDFFINIELNLLSDYDVRQITIHEPGYKPFTMDYKATDEMYEKQMDYFLDNIDNYNIENNLKSASRLFKQIIRIREDIHETIDNIMCKE